MSLASPSHKLETTDDGRRDSGFCNAVCRGMGGAGGELNRLMEVQTAAAPDFVWQLLDWTARGNVVIIEWQTTRIVNGARFDWRGVDKFRIEAGKIIEERVYCDTAPLRALRTGEALEPITKF